MKYPDKVKIVDVGSRDGLQNEPSDISTETKVELVNRLSVAGLKFIEVAAFVSPKWVPKMADSGDVMEWIERREGVVYSVLTPNTERFKAAQKARADEVSVLGAASETFSQKNINCTIEESLQRFEPVCNAALEAPIRVRGYISCVLGCPYAKGASGNVANENVLYMLDGLGIETGVDLVAMVEAGGFISEVLGRPSNAHVTRALSGKAAA